MHKYCVLFALLYSLSFYAVSSSIFELGQRSFLPINTHQDESISDVVQGSNGLIWMSTQRGVHYYDGFNFIKPTALETRKERFHFYFVNKVWFAKNTDIFVGTRSRGVFWYSSELDKWQQINQRINEDRQKKHLEQSIKDFVQLPSGAVWLASDDSLCLVDGQNLLLDCINSLGGVEFKSINSLFHNGDSLYIATEQGLLEVDVSSGSLSALKLLRVIAQDHQVSLSRVDKDGQLWLASKLEGLFRYSNQKLEKFSDRRNIVDIEFWGDQLWFGSSAPRFLG